MISDVQISGTQLLRCEENQGLLSSKCSLLVSGRSWNVLEWTAKCGWVTLTFVWVSIEIAAATEEDHADLICDACPCADPKESITSLDQQQLLEPQIDFCVTVSVTWIRTGIVDTWHQPFQLPEWGQVRFLVGFSSSEREPSQKCAMLPRFAVSAIKSSEVHTKMCVLNFVLIPFTFAFPTVQDSKLTLHTGEVTA